MGEGVGVVLVDAEVAQGLYYTPGEVVRALVGVFREGDDFHLWPFLYMSNFVKSCDLTPLLSLAVNDGLGFSGNVKTVLSFDVYLEVVFPF